MDLLERIFEPNGLETHVQPIAVFEQGNPRVDALECLTRGPAGTNLRRAEVLFEYVRRKGAEARVDRACIRQAFGAAATLPPELGICVNVHASTLSRDSHFGGFLLLACEAFGVSPARLTLEITEHTSAADGAQLLANLRVLRAGGMRVAVDDIGMGMSNLGMILDVAPEFFKIDRYVVAGCATDPRRVAVLETLQNLASRLGGSVVAEGVETKEDLDVVLGCGIRHIQGYLIGRPVEASLYAATHALQQRSEPQPHPTL